MNAKEIDVIFERWNDLDLMDRDHVVARWFGYVSAANEPLSIRMRDGKPISLHQALTKLGEIVDKLHAARTEEREQPKGHEQVC